MTAKNRISFSLIFLLCTGILQAGTITVTFAGAGTGVNDGVYYVMPYQILLDQGSGAHRTDVICYDVFDDVRVGDSWTANLLDLADAASYGYFSARPQALASYEEIAWLSVQSYSNKDQQVALQHAIWDVMGSSPLEQNARQRADLAAWQDAAMAAALGGYAGFDFSHIGFIEQVGGVVGGTGTEQAFVYSSPVALGTTPSGSGATPEPGTIALFGCGALLLLMYRRRMKNNSVF